MSPDSLSASAAAFCATLAERFRAACAREALVANPRLLERGITFEFADQESAPGALIGHHFGLELASAGVPPERYADLGGVSDDGTRAALATAIEVAVRRIRVLLIEHNSYLSGGLPWVFPPADPVLVQRGLSVYRFPKLAAVDVVAEEGAIRIAFAAGDLGAITSSGFYVPTRIAGDFRATLRYELPLWRPGPHTASVALFAQDEPSLHRYYAQRNSDPATPDGPRVLANLEGRLGEGRRTEGNRGWFRLERRGHEVAAWHRANGESAFVCLGATPAAPERNLPAPDVYFGAKIWSPGRCDGLVARLADFELVGRPAADQPPPPDLRPDPRAASGS